MKSWINVSTLGKRVRVQKIKENKNDREMWEINPKAIDLRYFFLCQDIYNEITHLLATV